MTSFLLTGEHNRSYGQQYANIYFMRLAKLKSVVLENAKRKWSDVADNPVHVARVLDAKKGKLCYIVGTVYMDMPLKPNVLVDLGKEHWITAPPPRTKFTSADDSVLLEDDSGRVKLLGAVLKEVPLVTGVIVACLGLETSQGEFQVMDVCFAGMAPNPPGVRGEMEIDEGQATSSRKNEGKWVALVSGLDLSSNDVPPGEEDAPDIRLQMLIEYLKGESGGAEEQRSSMECSALIILGNSLDVSRRGADDAKNAKRYGQQAIWDPAPLARLSAALKDLASSLPVHLLPGATDPASAILPQQAMPRAMFGFDPNKNLGRGIFACETNPAWVDVGGDVLLASAGQNLGDVFKYLESEDRLNMAKAMVQWRHIAPTCPDTLWCYPFYDEDPFLLKWSPRIYAIGNQPAFGSDLVTSDQHGDRDGGDGDGRRTRVVLVPRFSTSGEVVFVHTGTLIVKTMRFGLAAGWGT